MMMPFLTRIPIRLTMPNMQVKTHVEAGNQKAYRCTEDAERHGREFTSARLMRLKWKSRMKKMIKAAIITPDVT